MSTATDDHLLVSRVSRRDEDALAELFRRHGGAVLGVARRLVRDASLAEDVAQEVFVRLWTRPDRFDPARGGVRSFLLRDTHGRAIDLLRSEEARRAREDRERRRSSAAAPGPEHEVLEIVQSEQVRAALAALPEMEREAVVLAYYGGLSYREVAERLGQPEGSTKSRIRSAMQRLRTIMVSQGIAET